MYEGHVKEFWQDDVGDIIADTLDYLEKRLAEFGVKLSDKNEDEIFEVMQKHIELLSNCNWKGHN